MANAEAAESSNVAGAPLGRIIFVSLALACLMAVACLQPSGLFLQGRGLRGDKDVAEQFFDQAYYDGGKSFRRMEETKEEQIAEYLQEAQEEENAEALESAGGADEAMVEEESPRQLGNRRRRRRRRRKAATPTPAPAPDRSSIHYPPYIRISAGRCEDFGYEQVTTTAGCLTAGTYISGNSEQDFNADMPAGGWSIQLTGGSASARPGGCANYGAASSLLDLHYFPDHSAECGTNDYHCLCSFPSSFSTTPVPYIMIFENECATFGYKSITDADACTAAGMYLARSPAPVARVDSTVGSSRPKGCSYHSSNRRAFASSSTLLFFQQGSRRWPAGACGTASFACICEL